MGVYIKGMEMPKVGAYTCELGVLDENTAVLTINTPIDEPQRSYRLIPVPPHGRLGDLDVLVEAMARMVPWAIADPTANSFLEGLSAAYEAIQAAPTIIPAEEGE